MAQWWDRSPPTNVSRVRFPDPASYVDWVCCWFSSLLREVFLWVLRFPPLLKNQQFQIPIRFGIVKHFIISLWLGWLRKHSLCLTLNLHLHLRPHLHCNGDLYATATFLQRLSLFNGHLSTMTTCLQWPPLYNGHLTITATSRQWLLLFNGTFYWSRWTVGNDLSENFINNFKTRTWKSKKVDWFFSHGSFSYDFYQ